MRFLRRSPLTMATSGPARFVTNPAVLPALERLQMSARNLRRRIHDAASASPARRRSILRGHRFRILTEIDFARRQRAAHRRVSRRTDRVVHRRRVQPRARQIMRQRWRNARRATSLRNLGQQRSARAISSFARMRRTSRPPPSRQSRKHNGRPPQRPLAQRHRLHRRAGGRT